MLIRTLALQNFRNYKDRTIGFDSGVNILTGKNGEGKTNMLESVHILSMGRSFRTQNDAEAIRFGSDFYRIKGLFERDGEDLTVEVRAQGTSKSYFIDGIKVQKGADLLDHALTVIFSPDDLRIVKDGPDKRRKFMDHELFQLKPLYYLDVNKYKRIIKNRNLLLKGPVLNEHLLDVYDSYLAETGARIMAERAGFAARLAEISAGIHDRITAPTDDASAELLNNTSSEPTDNTSTDPANKSGRLEVSYEPSIEIKDEDFSLSQDGGRGNIESRSERLQEVIANELKARREKDRDAGATTKGPHKDDLKLAIGGIDLRKYGSQGQQRTASLALKLAEVDIIKEETGEMPILLLDDVLSELDEDRQRHLLGSFEDCQIIITTAELSEDLIKTFPKARKIDIIAS